MSNDGVETCDELDNDCNGLVDDLDPGFARCPTGLPGVCASGTPRCAGGEMICVVEHQGGRDEVCNMVDDDCDGQIDEAVRNACGRCGPTLPEQCDGLDNDCNGHVDEGNLCAEGWECVDAACRRVCDGAEGSCQGSEHCEEGYCGGPCYGTDCPPGQSCLHDYGAGASCIDPCVEVECPPGTLCDSLGRCAPCEAIGCPPGQTCAGGDRCVPDPCDGVECERDEACVEGECLSSCAAVACAMGESCRRGRCVEDPCGGVRCPDGLVCNENAACVNDECQGTDCQPGEICHRGDCQGDPCIATRCPDPERCEVFCVRNDCFGRCYPNWHAETSVGEGPDPDPEPDPEAPPGDSGADAGLGGDAGRATAGGDGDGQQPGGDGDGPPDAGTLDAGSGGGGVPDAAEGPVQRSTTDCANCSLGASSAQPAWLRLLGVLAGRR